MDASLLKQLKCWVCYDVLLDPLWLPCRHLVCRRCCLGLLHRGKGALDTEINCPECGKTIPIDKEKGVNVFEMDRLMKNITEGLRDYEKDKSVDEPPAAFCSIHREPRFLHCRECDQLKCPSCILLSCSKFNHKIESAMSTIKKLQVELISMCSQMDGCMEKMASQEDHMLDVIRSNEQILKTATENTKNDMQYIKAQLEKKEQELMALEKNEMARHNLEKALVETQFEGQRQRVNGLKDQTKKLIATDGQLPSLKELRLEDYTRTTSHIPIRKKKQAKKNRN